MSHLFQALAGRVDDWRRADYPCTEYPAIREVLEFAVEEPHGQSRYLRRAQLRALRPTGTCLDVGDEGAGYVAAAFSPYTAAAELAGNYHLPTPEVLVALRAAYGGEPVPAHHLDALGAQIEAQRADYEPHYEEIDVALALVRATGFTRHEGAQGPVYTARISFAKDREPLYCTAQGTADPAQALATSFHYEGYNFDSGPEGGPRRRAWAARYRSMLE